MTNSSDLPVLRQILREYADVALAHPSLPPHAKLKLRLESYVLLQLPAPVIRTLKNAAKLPVLSDLVRRLRPR